MSFLGGFSLGHFLARSLGKGFMHACLGERERKTSADDGAIVFDGVVDGVLITCSEYLVSHMRWLASDG